MSAFAIAILVAALALVVAAEWTRIQRLIGAEARKTRERERRKRTFRVVESESDPDEFQRAVERDLAALPTIEERDAGNGNKRQR